MFSGSNKTILVAAFLILFAGAARAEDVVTFETEDGWKLTGSLFLPQDASAAPRPGVLLLSEPGWEDRTIFTSYLGEDLAKTGFVALSMDYRGTGASVGHASANQKRFEKFTAKEKEGIALDIRAAMRFLAKRPGVDANRLGIVAASWTASYAVREASGNSDVRALVLISGAPGESEKTYLDSEGGIPVLGVVGKDDKENLLELAKVYADSKNDSSDLLIAVGYGAGMFSHTKGLEGKVVAWLDRNLQGLGSEREISFQSKDGWTVQGLLRIPPGASPGSKVPGVVMVHGAKHDQQTYHEMAPQLAKEGIATLRFDWRGKGRSIAEGKSLYGIDMPGPVSSNIYLDVEGAIELLASQPEVDATRIGLIAATAGTGYALRAAHGDERIQTVVLLTSNAAPTGEAKEFLAQSGKPVFFVASDEDMNYERGSLAEETRQAYSFSSSKESQFLLYDDAGRGSEMLKAKPELARMVLRWFAEKLGTANPRGAGESSQVRQQVR
jgi:dienelactone hydrolase